MNAGQLCFFVVYLLLGLTLIPLARKSPNYFGPAKELMEFLVVFTASGGGIGILVAAAFALLWPAALLLGLLVPSLVLGNQPSSHTQPGLKKEPALIGSIARCQSELKPSGFIEIGGRTYDATSLKEFIPKGTRVKVVGMQGFSYIVEIAPQ